jgi:hypothetical protein
MAKMRDAHDLDSCFIQVGILLGVLYRFQLVFAFIKISPYICNMKTAAQLKAEFDAKTQQSQQPYIDQANKLISLLEESTSLQISIDSPDDLYPQTAKILSGLGYKVCQARREYDLREGDSWIVSGYVKV